ncbi:MAG: BlaI/MecI/CopY family transcriptional regulator [Acidimicrobiia bacterium]
MARTASRSSSLPTSPADPSRLSRLGKLEARVMEALWDRGGWLTPREVLELLIPERDPAYTTVMTILVRLWRKGMLERRKDGRAYAYHPVQSREEWTARRMSELLSIADDRAAALSEFVDTMNRSDRDQLRRLLRIDR